MVLSLALAFNLCQSGAQFAEPEAVMETEPCGLDTYPCMDQLRLEP